jgi:CHASE1-domain containing sensor protein
MGELTYFTPIKLITKTKPMPSKRKDSMSGVTTDDPTDNSEGTESYFLKPTKHDLLPLMLAIISIAAGLTASLTSYFVLRAGETGVAKNALATYAAAATVTLTAAVKSVVTQSQSTTSMFQISKTPITLYDQFEPFMYSSGSFPQYLSSTNYLALIPLNNTQVFTDTMRAKGDIYANFTVGGRDSNNNYIPPIDVPTRCICTMLVPSSGLAKLLGYDLCTDSVRGAAINQAITTGKPACTGRVLSALKAVGTVTMLIYMPVFNKTTGAADGVISSAITISSLLYDALNVTLHNDVIISVLDTNITLTNSSFVYATVMNEDGTELTPEQNQDMINSAPYTQSGYVTLADRVFQIILMPGDNYALRFENNLKWVSLVLSLCFMVVLLVGCVFLYFSKKLLIARQHRQRAHIQIDLLKTNQTSLRILLDRISNQETKTRAVINSLPDFVCCISNSGKILQTNTAFDEEFPFSQQELEKGVYTWDIFTELSSDFFKTSDDGQELKTHAARRFGDTMEVMLRVRDLKGKDAESSSSNNDIKGGSSLTKGVTSTTQLPDHEEAYVLIAKNISHRVLLSEQQTAEKVKRHEFERLFRDKKFRDDLKDFCTKNKTVENVLFLEKVREYRKANFSDRVEMKQHIFDQFVKHDASLQLNLANEVIVEETIKIKKSMADVDVFKTVEECVFKILANDIYPRFVNERKNSSSSSTGSQSEKEPTQ